MTLKQALPPTLLLATVALLSQTTPPPAPFGAEDPRRQGADFAGSRAPEFAWLMFLNLISPATPGVRGIRNPAKAVGIPSCRT